MMQDHFPFQKTPPPYSYSSLLPALDPDTVYLHCDQIYFSYVIRLNYALTPYPQFHGWTLEELIMGEMNIPTIDQNAIRHLAGGVYNHRLYFDGLSRTPKPEPTGELRAAIDNTYGSFSNWKEIFRQATDSLLGVGWAWLNSSGDGNLSIAVTLNNKTPSLTALTPLLALDTWEHAYYLKYPADFESYLKNWFELLDWETAERRFPASLPAKPEPPSS